MWPRVTEQVPEGDKQAWKDGGNGVGRGEDVFVEWWSLEHSG